MTIRHRQVSRPSQTEGDFGFNYGKYINLLKSTKPVCIWPLGESLGNKAKSLNGDLLKATYSSGITLNSTKFVDGTNAPLFDATGDVITFTVANLDIPFDPNVGTMLIWAKPRVSTVWTDGVTRMLFSIGSDANNRIFFTKSATNNTFDLSYRAGGSPKTHNQSTYNPNRWFCIAITWDKVSDRVKFYLDGIQVGLELSLLGTWTGSLTTSFSAIGNFTQAGGANFWDGYLKYPTLYNRVLTSTEIARLAPTNFLV